MASPALAPVVTFNSASSPYGSLGSLAISGSGPAGVVPLGSTSSVATLRVYNNAAGATSIKDAANLVLAVYDGASAGDQGQAVGAAASGQWVQVLFADYDGNTTGADSAYSAIGGSVKHALPFNSGALAGSGSDTGTASHYTTVQLQLAVPLTAVGTTVSCGLWVEYTWT